jgi:hypothetical protein
MPAAVAQLVLKLTTDQTIWGLNAATIQQWKKNL